MYIFVTKEDIQNFLPIKDKNLDYKKMWVVLNSKYVSEGVTIQDVSVWKGKPPPAPKPETEYMNVSVGKV